MTPQAGETVFEFKKRLIKNTAIVLAFTAGVTTGLAASFVLLPQAFAIPIALSILFLAGEVVLDAQSYLKKCQATWAQIKDAFTRREGESVKEATLRILRNVLVVSVVAAAAIGVGIAIYSLFIYVMYALEVGIVGRWNIYDLLPFQTPLVIFAEYISVGLAHGALAVKKWREGEKKAALFHLVNLILGFYFPIFYQLSTDKVRLHHSMIGMLVSLIPSNSLKILGSLITLDSFSYLFAAKRGHWGIDRWGGKVWRSWDFLNLFGLHFSKYFSAYTTTTAAEIALRKAS